MDIKYVVGFMFSRDLKKVALIRKNHPEWQAGKLNGIGGHIEKTDKSYWHAMIREFQEETGFTKVKWKHFARLFELGDFDIRFFCTTGNLRLLKTLTDEKIIIVKVKELLSYNTIENLSWLVPLAIDHLIDGRPHFVNVTYPKSRE